MYNYLIIHFLNLIKIDLNKVMDVTVKSNIHYKIDSLPEVFNRFNIFYRFFIVFNLILFILEI